MACLTAHANFIDAQNCQAAMISGDSWFFAYACGVALLGYAAWVLR